MKQLLYISLSLVMLSAASCRKYVEIPPENVLSLPMLAGNRSLNLANAAAIAVYEAWRQAGFSGAV